MAIGGHLVGEAAGERNQHGGNESGDGQRARRQNTPFEPKQSRWTSRSVSCMNQYKPSRLIKKKIKINNDKNKQMNKKPLKHPKVKPHWPVAAHPPLSEASLVLTK